MASIAEYALEVERACHEIEAADGEITDDMLGRLAQAERELGDKVDRWIGFLQSLESRIEHCKKQRNAYARAYKVAKNLERRLESFLMGTMIQFPHIYKGRAGTLKIRRNGQAKLIQSIAADRTFRDVIGDMQREICSDYMVHHNITTLDTDRLRRDLKAGREMSWAKLVTGQHLRIHV